VGHFAKDILPDGGYMLGGTAFYSGVQAHRLGNRVSIISSTADDLPLDSLPDGITCYIQPAPQSTTFENIYDAHGHRTQYLHDKASLLSADTAPILPHNPDILHLCPIIDEVAPDYARAYPHSKVCITPQGWLRQVDEHHRVSPKAWDTAEKVLSGAYALVFSEEDMGYDEQKIAFYAKQCPFAVCTRGGNPASLFVDGEREDIPPFPTPIIDPTGAGDIFATAFFTRLIETGNPHEAVIFAHWGASSSIGARGIGGILTHEAILARMNS
jgi:sugar/nucleoside kinase (ribokinase family)